MVAVLEDAGWEVDVDDNSLSAERRPLCDPRHHFVVVADDDQETRLVVDVTRRRPPDIGYQLQYGADTSP